ncbi:amino acid permease family protein (plasmid) [Bacillus cereus]|nr:amino acid permease family protein [Bacillus cereus]
MLLTWLLSKGAKESKRVNNAMVLIKIGIVVLFISVGIFYVKPENWIPFAPYGISGIFAGGAAVFFAMVGVSFIILRKTHPNLKRGFMVLLVPSLPIILITCCLFLMVNLPLKTWVYFGIWLFIGGIVYFMYSKRHSQLNKL